MAVKPARRRQPGLNPSYSATTTGAIHTSANLVIIDQRRMMREALKVILETPIRDGGFQFAVVGDGSDLSEVLGRVAGGINVDLLVMTLDGEFSQKGLADLAQARRSNPLARTVVLVDAADRGLVINAERHGIDGALSRDVSSRVLRLAAELVLHGQRLFPRQCVNVEIAGEFANLGSVWQYNERFFVPSLQNGLDQDLSVSVREREVLQLLIRGHSNKVIARELEISEATVKVHVKGLLRKLRVANRTQAAMLAVGVAPASVAENVVTLQPALRRSARAASRQESS